MSVIPYDISFSSLFFSVIYCDHLERLRDITLVAFTLSNLEYKIIFALYEVSALLILLEDCLIITKIE